MPASPTVHFSRRARRALLAASCAMPMPVLAAQGGAGTLYITASNYAGNAGTVQVGQALPISTGAKAVANGQYPGVFGNDAVDANFGITSPIELIVAPVTYSAAGGTFSGQETRIDVSQQTKVVTSFASKSELGIHLSTDGSAITFTGYFAGLNALDVSNSNTTGYVDGTNTDIQTATYRSIIQYNLATGLFSAPTNTDAYSGNNMRSAILAAQVNGTNVSEYLTTGNAGNGSGTEPSAIVADTGVQLAVPGSSGTTPVGVRQGTPGASKGFDYGFSVASIGDAADKSGKDDNFRGSAVFNNTLYASKGSGGNGVNTVYQLVPPGGGLPTASTAATTQVTIVPGFPTGLATNIVDNSPSTEFYPFGIWFANATTMYVADEGPQDLTADVNAGLQKWVFNGTNWVLAYTIQNGLNLDVPYSVTGYPAQYTPAVTGLRNVTGVVTGNAVVLYATTATFSSLADPGADPNAVVEVVDSLNATTLPAGDSFSTVVQPFARQVYRGVLFNPALAR